MKSTLFILLILFLISCGSSNEVRNDSSYDNEPPKHKVEYDYFFTPQSIDYDEVQIIVSPIIFKLEFAINNKTEEPIKLIWDESTLILDGVQYRIFGNGVRFSERSGSKVPAMILPNVVFQDVMLPVETVTFVQTIRDWGRMYSKYFPIKLHDDFPMWMAKGIFTSKEPKEATIIFALSINGNTKYFTYTFKFWEQVEGTEPALEIIPLQDNKSDIQTKQKSSQNKKKRKRKSKN